MRINSFHTSIQTLGNSEWKAQRWQKLWATQKTLLTSSHDNLIIHFLIQITAILDTRSHVQNLVFKKNFKSIINQSKNKVCLL